MALLLNIDTAVQSASICLADGNEILDVQVSASEKDSSSWLHVAIQDVMQKHSLHLTDLKAIAVTSGPGSYTGLRVGMSAAKGLCFALSIPLITLNTLQVMAASVNSEFDGLLCPMIDARRMEVFTAIYTSSLEEVMPSTAIVLEPTTFNNWLDKNSILFFGNGSEKASVVIKHTNATFRKIKTTAAHMPLLSTAKFETQQFTELAYSEPFYAKDFYSPISTKNY